MCVDNLLTYDALLVSLLCHTSLMMAAICSRNVGAQGLGFIRQLEVKLVFGAKCNVLMSTHLNFIT